ncbi:MAG: helix-turn-helix domain-containing protein [Capsulimonadaceae bacterium]
MWYSAPINQSGAGTFTKEEWRNIKDLQRQGYSIRRIARVMGCSRNTIRRKLAEKTPVGFATPLRPSRLDPYKDYLKTRYEDCGLSAVRLLDEIQPMGYTGPFDLRTLLSSHIIPSYAVYHHFPIGGSPTYNPIRFKVIPQLSGFCRIPRVLRLELQSRPTRPKPTCGRRTRCRKRPGHAVGLCRRDPDCVVRPPKGV